MIKNHEFTKKHNETTTEMQNKSSIHNSHPNATSILTVIYAAFDTSTVRLGMTRKRVPCRVANIRLGDRSDTRGSHALECSDSTLYTVGMDSYKRGNKILLHAMNERHVLPSGEKFVLFSILTLQYTQFSTTFLIQIRRNSLSSYAVFIPNYVKNAISHLPVETQFLELTTEYFQKQRLTQIIKNRPKNENR
jgi:hypothetical protein